MKQGEVLYQDLPAGTVTESEDGYLFESGDTYLAREFPAISLTLPALWTEKFF